MISNIYVVQQIPKMLITQVVTYLPYNYYQFIINKN